MPTLATPNEEIIEFLLLCIEHNPGKINFDEVAKESTLTRNASAAYQKLYSMRRRFRQQKPAPDPTGENGVGSGSEVFGGKKGGPVGGGKVAKSSTPRKRRKRVRDDGTGGEAGAEAGAGEGEEGAAGVGNWRDSEGFVGVSGM